MDKKQFGNFKSLKGIKVIEDGKRFESFIGWSFSRDLKCEKYHQGVDYSLKEEKDLILSLLKNNNIKSEEIEKIKNNLDNYEKDLEELKSINSSSNNSSKSDSKSDINKTSSDINNTSDIKNDLSTINKNNNVDNYNKNNNINIVNKSHINNNVNNINVNNNIKVNNINNDKEIKKAKKKAITYKRVGDVYGNIDVIIPNVQKFYFLKMLNNNFYHLEADRCIIYDKDKLDYLPDTFHLLIEVGLNAFSSDMPHKIKQIRKYISLINLRNCIDNESIKKLYIDGFANRLSLNINLKKGNNIANTFIYLLISNSDYGTFTHKFLDNKSYEGEKNNEFDNISLMAPDELIFFGFVNFSKGINDRLFSNKETIDEQNKKIANLEKSLNNIKILVISMIICFLAIFASRFINKGSL